MKTAILGCGWLGLPLAKKLTALGHQVHGSTTSPGKTEALAASGIGPFLLRISEDGIEGNTDQFLRDAETLVVGIPPKLRGEAPENFVQKIGQLASVLEKFPGINVLFISSISVYGDKDSLFTEETLPQPATESGKQLLASEAVLQANPAFRTTVLRLSGLIGPERHPVYHLAGKTGLENPDAPVNLIHLEDCLGIITEIIRQKKWGELYHAAFPSHPTRETYYTEKAKALGLDPPGFGPSSGFGGKVISSEKLQHELGYTYKGVI